MRAVPAPPNPHNMRTHGTSKGKTAEPKRSKQTYTHTHFFYIQYICTCSQPSVSENHPRRKLKKKSHVAPRPPPPPPSVRPVMKLFSSSSSREKNSRLLSSMPFTSVWMRRAMQVTTRANDTIHKYLGEKAGLSGHFAFCPSFQSDGVYV